MQKTKMDKIYKKNLKIFKKVLVNQKNSAKSQLEGCLFVTPKSYSKENCMVPSSPPSELRETQYKKMLMSNVFPEM